MQLENEEEQVYSLVSYFFIKQDQTILTCNSAVASLMISRFFIKYRGSDGSAGLPNNSYKPITNTAWVHARLCKLQKGYTRLASASNKVYQLLAPGRWLSPGTPSSSTTKTGHDDIAEILLNVTLNTTNQIKC